MTNTPRHVQNQAKSSMQVGDDDGPRRGPAPHGLRRTTGSGLVGLPDLAGMVVTLDAPHVMALSAGALMLVCVSFLGSLNAVVMWTFRLIAWAMIATVILLAP
jgi:hypothetical protein